MSDTTKPVSSTEKERNDWLHRLWVAHTKKLIEKIENTPADELDAATLNQSRQLLSDNGVNSASLQQQTGELAPWQHRLPSQAAVEAMDELNQPDDLPAPDWPDVAIR